MKPMERFPFLNNELYSFIQFKPISVSIPIALVIAFANAPRQDGKLFPTGHRRAPQTGGLAKRRQLITLH